MIIPQHILSLFFLLPLFLVGGMASYSDIKYGKIKNRHILFGLVYILGLYLFLFVYGWSFLRQSANLTYLGELLANATIAIIFGYILWYFNLWAAGDAKLFLLYALLVPLEIYGKDYISFFPSASLLIDTFFLICLFFLVTILIKEIHLLADWLKKHKLFSRNAWIVIFNFFKPTKISAKSVGKLIWKVLKLPLVYVSFLVFLEGLETMAPLTLQTIMAKPLNLYLLILGLQLLVFRPFSKNKYFVPVMMGLGVLGSIILCLHHSNPLLSILRPSILFMVFFNLIIQFVYSYIEKHETLTITPTQLCPGMVLTADCVTRIKSKLQTSGIEITNSDGLSELQVANIKAFCQTNPEVTFNIYKTIPYAPFMFAAFLGALIVRGSILSQVLKSLHLQN